MYLMLEDEKVLYFDLEDGTVQTVKEELVPFSLRGGLQTGSTLMVALNNLELLRDWLSSRMLSLSRENAKQIYAAFNLEQSNSTSARVKFSLACKALSLQDSYWIKSENDATNWGDNDLKVNRFSEIVDIALSGNYPSVTENLKNPQLTTKGLFRKAWIRDKGLWLIKADRTDSSLHARMEVLASDILKCVKSDTLTFVEYELTEVNGETVSKCMNFSKKHYSFVEAREVMLYCSATGVDFLHWLEDNGINGFADVPVIDYLVANTDRHTENYGFLMDNRTGCLVGFQKLFDFNLALVSDYFNKSVEDTISQTLNDGQSIYGSLKRFCKDSSVLINFCKLQELYQVYPEYVSILDAVVNRAKHYVELKKLL